MLRGMAGLTIIYNVVQFVFKDSVSVCASRSFDDFLSATCLISFLCTQPMAIPAEAYCPEDNPQCFRPDLLAFQLTCFAALLYLGCTGFYTWHITKRVHTLIPESPQGRIFGYLRDSERIAAVNLTFQVWNFVASLCIEEHCTLILLAHHAVAGLVSWSSLESAYMHYYASKYNTLHVVLSVT